MAPAVTASEKPSAWPMPIRATPTVAMVVQDEPIISETTAQSTHEVSRKTFGWMSLMP